MDDEMMEPDENRTSNKRKSEESDASKSKKGRTGMFSMIRNSELYKDTANVPMDRENKVQFVGDSINHTEFKPIQNTQGITESNAEEAAAKIRDLCQIDDNEKVRDFIPFIKVIQKVVNNAVQMAKTIFMIRENVTNWNNKQESVTVNKKTVSSALKDFRDKKKRKDLQKAYITLAIDGLTGSSFNEVMMRKGEDALQYLPCYIVLYSLLMQKDAANVYANFLLEFVSSYINYSPGEEERKCLRKLMFFFAYNIVYTSTKDDIKFRNFTDSIVNMNFDTAGSAQKESDTEASAKVAKPAGIHDTEVPGPAQEEGVDPGKPSDTEASAKVAKPAGIHDTEVPGPAQEEGVDPGKPSDTEASAKVAKPAGIHDTEVPGPAQEEGVDPGKPSDTEVSEEEGKSTQRSHIEAVDEGVETAKPVATSDKVEELKDRINNEIQSDTADWTLKDELIKELFPKIKGRSLHDNILREQIKNVNKKIMSEIVNSDGDDQQQKKNRYKTFWLEHIDKALKVQDEETMKSFCDDFETQFGFFAVESPLAVQAMRDAEQRFAFHLRALRGDGPDSLTAAAAARAALIDEGEMMRRALMQTAEFP